MITGILIYFLVSIALGALMEFLIRETGETISILERMALMVATPFLLTCVLIELIKDSIKVDN